MGNTKGKSVEIRGYKSAEHRDKSVEIPTNYCLQNQIATGLEAFDEVNSVERFMEKTHDFADPPRGLYLNYVLCDNGKEVFTKDGQIAKNFLRGL